MAKPKLIQELEQELNATFKLVDVNEIMKIYFGKASQYAINEKGEIIGLKINEFGLEELPQNIKEFKDLQFLNLFKNKIINISILSNLTNITKLDLYNNRISDISALSNLTKLTSLDLSINQFSDISALSNLTNLTQLNLQDNQLSDISALSNLTNLTELDLEYNRISDISVLSNLTNLTKLKLYNNQISDISALKKLENLEILNLKKNPIEKLPEWICDFPQMDIQWNNPIGIPNSITLYDNPLKEPPIEIVKQGKEAIRNYFKKKKQEGTDYLYEAKLILVGEERAGKSTIAKALTQNKDFKIDPKQSSTEGIDILKWIIPQAKTKTPKDFRFNIWDFGGQEIYHATHQFFLTKRSLYLFVTEARKDLRFDDFYYWLNIINTLGGKSHILAVQNKIDQSSTSSDIQKYKKMFPQLLNDNLIGVSCNTEHQKWETKYLPILNNFKDEIYEVVAQKRIESMGTPLPKTWVDVRKEISQLQEQGLDYITLSEYKEICKKYNLDKQTITSLSRLFHDLGILVHFADNIKLSNTIFLNHEYITEGVYKIFDNEKIKESHGEFTEKVLIEILQDTKYAEKQAELISLCEEFKILFKKNDSYYAPQLFDETEIKTNWASTDNLHYVCSYSFMPKGIVSYLTVEMEKYIDNSNYWRYGVVLKEDDNFAYIEEKRYESKNEIAIKVRGKNAKNLLDKIRTKLDEINASFTNLKTEEKIGCVCDECRNSDEPYFFGYDYINKALQKRKETIVCQKSIDDVSILKLLGYYEIQKVIEQINNAIINGNNNIIIQGIKDSIIHVNSDKKLG